jgi:predicted ATPase
VHEQVRPLRFDSAPYPADRANDSPSHNLPPQPTPLIGRAEEVSHLASLLSSATGRLVTLTGPGGVGKTRVAIAAAEAVLPHFPGGVVFVDLTPLTDPARLTVEIARALSGGEECATDPFVAIAEQSRQRTLLILDTFEHLGSAALIIETLVTACPRLTVLATSRERLHLRREQIVEVRSLPVPSLTRSSWTVDELEEISSVRCFVDRAQAVESSFALSEENASAVAQLTRRLDGLPLALELAASRTRFLDPVSILERLDHSLALLRCETCDLPSRHRTLRASLEWSYDLLDAEQQTVFRRLGVFAGAFTLDEMIAVAVTNDLEREPLDFLAALTDKHLMEAVGNSAAVPLFRLLTAVREFALEKLTESGEAELMSDRYVAFNEPVDSTPDQIDYKPNRNPISRREREVLALVTEGHSNRAIADALFVTPNTIKTHVASLLTKLGAQNRTQLATMALEREPTPI